MRRSPLALLLFACAPGVEPPIPPLLELPAAPRLERGLDSGFALGPRPGFAGGQEDRLLALAIDGLGRVLAAGYSRDPDGGEHSLLLRLGAGGALDPSFGQGGVVLGPRGRLGALALDPQGRVLAAGRTSFTRGRHHALLLRLLPDGRWDRSFGDTDPQAKGSRGWTYGQGAARAHRPYSGADFAGSVPDEAWAALAVDSGGRVLVAGRAGEVSNALFRGPGLRRAYYHRALSARFDERGQLDPLYAGGGWALGKQGAAYLGAGDDELTDLAPLPGGGHALAGWAAGDAAGEVERTLLLIRGSAGEELAARGLGPERSAAGGSKEVYYALRLDHQGRWLLAGFSFDLRQAHIQAMVQRLLPGGAPDPSFGTGGTRLEGPAALSGSPIEYYVAVAEDRRGRILAAGFTDDRRAYGDTVDHALLTRYLPDGSRDTTFGRGGVLASWTGTTGASRRADGQGDAFFDLALDDQDRPLVCGTSAGRALLVRADDR